MNSTPLSGIDEARREEREQRHGQVKTVTDALKRLIGDSHECEHRVSGQICGACEGCETAMCSEALAAFEDIRTRAERIEAAARKVVEESRWPFADPLYRAIDDLASALEGE